MHASRDKKKTHAATPGVEVKALVKTLEDRLAEVKAKTVSDTLGHVEAYSLVNKFATREAEMKAKTIDGRVRDFQAQALVHTTATRGKSENNAHILRYGEERSKWRPRYFSTCLVTR